MKRLRHMAHAAIVPESIPLGGRGCPRIFARANTTTAVGELHIYGDIGWDGVTEKDVVATLATLKGTKGLNVYLNSPGGEVTTGLAIYNLLARMNDVTVHVDGIAASIASIIAMAGKKIVTAANALWMIHDPWFRTSGTANDLRAAAAVLDKTRGVLVDTYAKRTKQKREKIDAWMAAETWMDAKEAKERGFTDEIADDRVIENLGGFAALDLFKNTPAGIRALSRANTVRLADAKEDILRMRNRTRPDSQREGQPRAQKQPTQTPQVRRG